MASSRPRSRIVRVRLAVQVAALLGVLALYRHSEYQGADRMDWTIGRLFDLDPLAALGTTLTTGSFASRFWPALVLLALTLVLGRFFCGWLCPLGTTLDLAGPRIRGSRRGASAPASWARVKYYLLGFLLVAAVAGLPLYGVLDPLCLFVRSVAFSLDPGVDTALRAPFDAAWAAFGSGRVTAVTEPVYTFLKDWVLPFETMAFQLAALSLGILVAVLALERVVPRFWCRVLCPLGALLAIPARFARLRWLPDSACTECGACHKLCPTDALDESRRLAPGECTLCHECVVPCPMTTSPLAVGAWPDPETTRPVGVDRRWFLGALGAGLAVPAAVGVLEPRSEASLVTVVRPPGALDEPEFLDRCIRCGACMKICLGNALQPTLFQAGIEGMFTPHLVARTGYCELDCTLCGQTCPTGALRVLTKEDKRTTVMGTAWFDRSRCLPYARGAPCIVCEEHCPTPEKAIKFRQVQVTDERGQQVMVKQPYVDSALCIGCGICENKCPLAGEAAVHVGPPYVTEEQGKIAAPYGGGYG